MSPLTGSALFCLHSALLTHNTLIFNRVKRADNSQKRVHYHLHLSALHMTEDGRSGAEFLLWEDGVSVMGGRIFCRTDKFAARESGKTKCARFEKRNVQKSGKTKRSKNFAHTTL